MDNQFIFKYSWETLPKKWVKKMERSEHGNRSDTNTDYPFQLLCFLKLHTYTRAQVLIDICGVDHPSRKRRFEVEIIDRNTIDKSLLPSQRTNKTATFLVLPALSRAEPFRDISF